MPDKENKDKRKWYILDGRSISLLLVLLIAILFYVALTHFDVIQTRLSLFMGVVSPFIAGFAIAYLLNTPMCFFERKVYRKLRFKRGLSILTVYLLALALVVILLQMILPQVVQSIMDLATNMQYYLNGLERLVQQVTEQFQLEGAGIEESLEFIKNWPAPCRSCWISGWRWAAASSPASLRSFPPSICWLERGGWCLS